MGKKTFLKAVSVFACLSILMLSVPGAIASERPMKKKTYTYRLFMKTTAMLSSLLPFLNLNPKGDTTSDQTYNDGSSRKIRISGTLSSVRKPNSGDGEDDEEKSAKRH